MGAQGRLSNSSNSMQRVKVYRLNEEGKWEDQGTGHVTIDYMERSEDLSLLVIDEEDNDAILVHRISSEDIYRRQEDTIISWRDLELSTELALSFQEASGCSYIWDHICGVQRNIHFNTLSSLDVTRSSSMETIEPTGALQSNDESFHGVNNEPRELPPVELSTLPLILKNVVECGITDQMRVAELILQDQDFCPKLMDLFRMCEDLENMEGLHMIFRLVRGIILLNSPQIFDKIFSEEYILDVIGSLEYDPDVPQVQHHRAFLKEHVVYKEAIPIKDPSVLSKIHQTYRIGYIKDVILPRVLDEATMTSLNSIIHANNGVVISLLKDDTSFIQELFARMRSSSISSESKRNLVLFLNEFCSLSKSLQLVQQLRLFRDLASEGIFDIITDLLQSQDKKLVSTGTDILILFLNQDPNLLRAYVIQQEGNSLLRLLVKGMITDFGEEMHCQFLEIIRILVDSYSMSGSQRDTIIEIFYEQHLDQLIDVIASSCPPKTRSQASRKSSSSGIRDKSLAATKPEILSNICELLCFCVVHHPYRIKCNFLMNNAIEKVLHLTRRREKFLVVAAVRFMRTIISRNDEHLIRHIVKNNLLKPVIEVFVDNGNRYNMLHSGVLELLEYIRKENLKSLILYVINSFWNQLQKFEHLGTIQALRLKYEQSLENCEIKNAINVADTRKRVDERALEKEEEDYFNEDSDEEDSASARLRDVQDHQASPNLPNGTKVRDQNPRPRSGGLVDYDDDEDDEDYNPPSRKPGSSTDGDETADSSRKSKRKSPDSKREVSELTKRQRLGQQPDDGKAAIVAPCTTCNHSDLPSKDQTASDSAEDTNASSNHSSVEKEAAVPHGSDDKEVAAPESCSNCLSSTVDTRQPSGEDCQPTPTSNSPQDIAVNGTDVGGSESFPVR